jgi:hypothetical protein
VLVDEAALAGVELDAVALQLRPDHVDFSIDDVLGADIQVRPRDPVLDAVAGAVEFVLVHPGQVDDRLAHALRRDRARVDAHAAHVATLDHRHRLAQLGRRDSSLLPARP